MFRMGVTVLIAFMVGVLDSLPMFDGRDVVMSIVGICLVGWLFATLWLIIAIPTRMFKKLSSWLPAVVIASYIYLLAANRLHAVGGDSFFTTGFKNILVQIGLVGLSILIAGLVGRLKTEKINKVVMVGWVVLAIVFGGLYIRGVYWPRQISKENNVVERQGKTNVILVTVDALRNDTVNKELMPNTVKFFEGGMRVEQAYAPSDWTAPSFASMMTGLSPSRLGNGSQLIVTEQEKTEKLYVPIGAETIAELLNSNGYLTQAMVNNFLLSKHRGFTDGFDGFFAHEDVKWWSWSGADQMVAVVKLMNKLPVVKVIAREFYEGVTEKSDKPWQNKGGEVIVDPAVEWLKKLKLKQGVFLWLHLTDTHSPYLVQPKFPSKVDVSPRKINSLELVDDTLKYADRLRLIDKEGVRSLYQGEAQYADLQLSKLWKYIDESGMSKNTIVILTADHGEEFWEHGDIGHSKTFYEESVRVPLLIKAQNSNVKVQNKTVSTMDLKGSIMDLLGLERAGEFSWFDTNYRKQIFVEANGAGTISRAVVSGDWKLIEDIDGNRELFNLKSDPMEKNNLVNVYLGLAEKLSKEMKSHFTKEEKESWGVKQVERGVYTGY